MALTINWTQPATGAVSPTAAQSANLNILVVNLLTDGALTTATLTHNWGVSAADLALGFPLVQLEPQAATAFDTLNIAMNPATGKTANTIVFTFAAVVGQVNVIIWRPYSMIR